MSLAGREPANRQPEFGGTSSLLRPFDDLLETHRGGSVRVLDVGCGSGDIARALTVRARAAGVRLRAVAVDADPVAVEVAREACRAWSDVEIVRADARRLPFADKTFDYVWSRCCSTTSISARPKRS